MKRSFALSVAVLVLMLSSLACQAAAPLLGVNQATPIAPAPAPQIQAAVPEAVSQPGTLTSLYESVYPGVVSIQVTTSSGGAQGSGFVFDSAGHIVTNQHVVDGAKTVEIDFASGFKAYGKVIGVDLDSDLAVIKVDAPAAELHPLTLGDSYALQVGQPVAAIGNPFGLSGTMTLGIVSALGRTLPSNRQSPGGGNFSAADLIQTDAAINPGNSGGPLFNLNGEVIGINRAIRTESATVSGEPVNSGIGFAIASNIVRRVVPAIIANGKYDYPYMGISSVDDLPLPEIELLGLTQTTGVYVMNVQPGSPADKAGILAGTQPTKINGLNAGGDLIIAIDGVSVKNFNEMMRYLVNNKGAGDTVTLTVLRGGQTVDVTVTLGKRP
ncbi:MAG: trypsin-like peptidase domain-containing protein [Anaerolineales bacterium]